MDKYNTLIKSIILTMITFIILSSVCVLLFKPQIHKPFSIDVVEYFLKIKSDGSSEAIKQVTTMEIKENK